MAGKLKVFISYSRADEALANELHLGLEDKGYTVEIDKHSIRQGEDWKARLAKLIAASDTVVFVLSPDSARSTICQWEVEEAHAQGKRIVPVLHRGLHERPKGTQPDGTPWPDGVVKAPERLSLLNYPRFDEGRSLIAGLRGLVQALEADHEWIEAHSRLAARARDWDDGGRPSNRLMAGRDIGAAKDLVASRKPSAPPMLSLQLDYIQASEQHESAQSSERERDLDERRHLAETALAASRRVVQRTRLGLAVATVLAVIATTAGSWAWLQRAEIQRQRAAAVREAVAAKEARAQAVTAASQALSEAKRAEAANEESKRQARIAEDERAKAVREAEVARLARADAEQQALAAQTARKAAADERGQSLIAQSRFLADQSIKAAKSGDATTAALLALEALPTSNAADARPLIGEAKSALYTAINSRARELRLISGHTDIIAGVDFSPDGKIVVTCSYDGEAKTWAVESGEQMRVFRGHTRTVSSCRFDDTGRRIVTTGWDGMIYVWNADTGERLTSIEVLKDAQLGGAAFSTDGKRIVLAGSRQRSWDAETGREEPRSAAEHEVRGSAIFAFDPMGRSIRVETEGKDDKREWTVSIDGLAPTVIRSRDAKYGPRFAESARALVFAMGDLRDGIASLVYPISARGIEQPVNVDADYVAQSPDDKTWIFKERDGSALVTEGLSTRVRYRIPLPPDDWSAKFSQPGNRIAIAGSQGTIRIVETASGETTLLAGHLDRIYGFAFSKDERYVVSSAEDGTARIWDIGAPPRDAPRLAPYASFLPANNHSVVAATDANVIGLLDMRAVRTVSQLRAHASPISFYMLSRSKKALLSVDDDGTSCVTEVSAELKMLKCRTDLGQAERFEWSDDETLIYATKDGQLRLWRTSEDGADRTVATGLGPITSLAYDARTDTIVVRRNPYQRIDVGESELLFIDRSKPGNQWSVVILDAAIAVGDGQVAAQRQDHSLVLFDLQKRTEKSEPLKGHNRAIERMTFDASGTLLLASSNTETLLWELPSGRVKRRFGRPVCGDYPRCGHWNLGFDTSSRRIVMSGWLDRYQGVETSVFDMDQETPLLSVVDGGDAVGASLLGDGRSLAYAATNGLAQHTAKLSVYALPDLPIVMSEVASRAPRCLSPAQRAHYLLTASPPAWCIERRLWPYEEDEWQAWLVKHKSWLAAGRQGDPPPFP